MFETFFIVSPSIDIGSSWIFVKTYGDKYMKVKRTDGKPICFDH